MILHVEYLKKQVVSLAIIAEVIIKREAFPLVEKGNNFVQITNTAALNVENISLSMPARKNCGINVDIFHQYQ